MYVRLTGTFTAFAVPGSRSAAGLNAPMLMMLNSNGIFSVPANCVSVSRARISSKEGFRLSDGIGDTTAVILAVVAVDLCESSSKKEAQWLPTPMSKSIMWM